MLNVHSASYEVYEHAPPLPELSYSFWIKLCLLTFLDIIKILFLIVPLAVQGFVNLFIPSAVKSVHGKIALITGGANGIGKHIAIELAQRGCNLVIADINNNEMIKTVKEISESYDVKCLGFNIDVADYTQIEKLKEFIKNNLGNVDILVNNAGLMPALSLCGGEDRDLERIVQVNVNGSIYILRAFLEDMIKQRSGHVVQLSSSSAFHALPGAVTYSATKFALIGLMNGIEQELRLEGFEDCIQFTTAYPYFTSTRADLMAMLNLRYPAVSVEYCARTIINAILKNKRTIIIPRFLHPLLFLINLVPYSLQCILRDRILREKETRIKPRVL